MSDVPATTSRCSRERRDWRETIKRAFGPLIAGAIALAKFTFVIAKFGQHLHRGRLLRADLRLEVRGRVRAADPPARARPLPRGAARRARPEAAGVHPVPRRVRAVHARQPVADGARRDRRADPRRARRARLLRRRASRSGSDLLLALAYFGFFLNLFNLMPVGIFDGGAVWRSARWLRLGGGRDEGDGRLRALLRHRARARRRDDRVARPAQPRVTSDREDPRRGNLGDRRVGREDRRRVPRRLREGRARSTSPAVALFGCARVDGGQRAVPRRARGRAQVRRGRLGGRHRRRAAA